MPQKKQIMYDEKNKFLPDNFIETWSISTYAGDSPLNLKPIEGISYPFYEEEFPHHVKAYNEMLKE